MPLWPDAGTPPRRRGGPPHPLGHLARHRKTPASAGRTPSSAPPSPGRSEHPRVGGEDEHLPRGLAQVRGTPPRRRGGPQVLEQHQRGQRNTPASAGRTVSPSACASSATEHPRVGGEDSCSSSSVGGCCGTPPRRRGGPGEDDRVDGADRNTPASAGRTRRTGRPRPLQRNTPASAGRTPARSAADSPGPEHLRVGGEDKQTGQGPIGESGTPPRRRGGPD